MAQPLPTLRFYGSKLWKTVWGFWNTTNRGGIPGNAFLSQRKDKIKAAFRCNGLPDSLRKRISAKQKHHWNTWRTESNHWSNRSRHVDANGEAVQNVNRDLSQTQYLRTCSWRCQRETPDSFPFKALAELWPSNWEKNNQHILEKEAHNLLCYVDWEEPGHPIWDIKSESSDQLKYIRNTCKVWDYKVKKMWRTTARV